MATDLPMRQEADGKFSLDLPPDLCPEALKKNKTIRTVGAVAVLGTAGVFGLVAGGTLVAGAITITGLLIFGTLITLGATTAQHFIQVHAVRTALQTQAAITQLNEQYAPERIQTDEREEKERLDAQTGNTVTSIAALQGLKAGIESRMGTFSPENQQALRGQIALLDEQITDLQTSLSEKTAAFQELKRQNEAYLLIHEAGKALKGNEEKRRNAAQLQAVETARAALKKTMREALVSSKIDKMKRQYDIEKGPSVDEIIRTTIV